MNKLKEDYTWILGVAVGVAVGVAMDNMMLWIPMGLLWGLVLRNWQRGGNKRGEEDEKEK